MTTLAAPTGPTRTPSPPPPPRVADQSSWLPTRTRSWSRDVIGALAWLSMLFVVALWVAGGGVADLAAGPAAAITTLGRQTGLVASNLLLVQVLLMARIPLVEQVYGQDELARRHRLVGFTSFNLMLAHIVLVTLGYALSESTNVFAEGWNLTVDYPGMLLAVAGTAALFLVTVTSIRIARRRLRYESWHLLHLYAYLGVGLALPHQLWTGQEFLSSTAATVYWWGLWAAAAASVLVWRVGVPVARTLRHRLRVSHVVAESESVVSVYLTGRDVDRLASAAGQFFVWRFLTPTGWTRGHPYSLSAVPRDDRLRVTVKDLGDGSAALAHVAPGTRVAIEGPYGRLHQGVRQRRKVTLMGAGIGITPLRALLEALPQGPGDVTLIYRASSAQDLVLRQEIDQVAAARGARVFYVVGPRLGERQSWLPSSAAHLGDADALRRLVPDIADQDVYLCGSGPWMAAARQAALDAGVPTEQVHEERFSW